VGKVRAGLVAALFLSEDPSPDEYFINLVNAITLEGVPVPQPPDLSAIGLVTTFFLPTRLENPFAYSPDFDAPPPDGNLIAKLKAGGVL